LENAEQTMNMFAGTWNRGERRMTLLTDIDRYLRRTGMPV